MKTLLLILSIVLLSSCGTYEPRDVEDISVPNYVTKEANEKLKKNQVDTLIIVKGNSSDYLYKVTKDKPELYSNYDTSEGGIIFIMGIMLGLLFAFLLGVMFT